MQIKSIYRKQIKSIQLWSFARINRTRFTIFSIELFKFYFGSVLFSGPCFVAENRIDFVVIAVSIARLFFFFFYSHVFPVATIYIFYGNLLKINQNSIEKTNQIWFNVTHPNEYLMKIFYANHAYVSLKRRREKIKRNKKYGRHFSYYYGNVNLLMFIFSLLLLLLSLSHVDWM